GRMVLPIADVAWYGHLYPRRTAPETVGIRQYPCIGECREQRVCPAVNDHAVVGGVVNRGMTGPAGRRTGSAIRNKVDPLWRAALAVCAGQNPNVVEEGARSGHTSEQNHPVRRRIVGGGGSIVPTGRRRCACGR